MLVVGLTGGIASGKSVVARMLKELGARVIDADAISREVMSPHTACWEKLLEQFGEGILDADLRINRKKLAAEIFGNADKRALLNSIVHPFIKDRINQMLVEIRHIDPCALVVIDAALLVETGQYRCYDKLVVVAACRNTQLDRVVRRDNLSRDEALQRVNAQLPLDEKEKVADFLISNDGSREETRRQTERLFQALCALIPEKHEA